MTTAIFDGNCVLCQQSRRIIQRLDWLHRVEFLNIHEWEAVQARYPNLDYETAMGQMHVDAGDGTLLGGFQGVRRILRDLPLTFVLWLILHIPGVNIIGEAVYRLIARNRYRINKAFGAPVCDETSCRVHY